MSAPLTEPEPSPVLAGNDLGRAIIDASRAYIAAQRTFPRDPELVADTKATLDALIAQREAAGG